MPSSRLNSLRSAIALAPCAFSVGTPSADDSIITIQLVPAGAFKPRDGRADVPDSGWHIDAEIAKRVVARFRGRANPPVLDYEHQTLNSQANGHPAPAAGWIRDIHWLEGQGLFALVELTARAARFIRDGEYRYVSPVFQYDPNTGEVLAIEMAALTNHPALDGMQPLALRAAAKFLHTEDSQMNPTLAAILAALNLPQDTSEATAVAALTALKTKADGYDGLVGAAGIAADATPAVAVAALTALKTKADAGTPDPQKFVAVATFESVKGELAALTAQVRGREVSELVEQGLANGKLLPAQKTWATELGQSNMAALRSYLDATAPIAALTGTQTGGKAPEGKDNDQLSEAELAICRATGVDPKHFIAAKAA